MRRGWPPPHRDSWDHRDGYWAWQRFGRKMLIGFVMFVVAAMLALFAIGAVFSMFFAGIRALPLAALVPIGLFVVVALGARSAGRTWRPVREMIRAAGSLADGDYSVRVPPTGSASMRPVAESFNEMARRLEEADEQRRRLLADVGHELRTPLTVVRGEIEAMLDGVHSADPDHLEQLLDEVAVMERLLEDLRTLSLAESGRLALHPEPTDLEALVDDVIDSHRRAAAENAILVERRGGGVGEVVIDPVRIREVVANLVVNAVRAIPDGGAVVVRTRAVAGEAVLEVADTGTGIGAGELDMVFERFHKGSTSSGSGLGLTISRDLVEAHGGTIAIDSEPGAGTTVTVRLPVRRIPGRRQI